MSGKVIPPSVTITPVFSSSVVIDIASPPTPVVFARGSYFECSVIGFPIELTLLIEYLIQ